jgi:hypothetical protein
MPTPSSLTRSFKSCEYFKPTSNRLHIECLHRVSNGLIGNAIDLVANHRGHLVRFANYGEKRLPSGRRETLPSRDVFHNLVMVKWGQLGTGFGMSSSLWVLSSSRPEQNASSAVCRTQPKDSLQARLESVT